MSPSSVVVPTLSCNEGVLLVIALERIERYIQTMLKI